MKPIYISEMTAREWRTQEYVEHALNGTNVLGFIEVAHILNTVVVRTGITMCWQKEGKIPLDVHPQFRQLSVGASAITCSSQIHTVANSMRENYTLGDATKYILYHGPRGVLVTAVCKSKHIGLLTHTRGTSAHERVAAMAAKEKLQHDALIPMNHSFGINTYAPLTQELLG